ncbi:MAG: ABC transporter ATP-binding protein [Oscillospiraceae bacterium]|nr:ABC transporter ATP-binding protein [Oscillospiraceae bacterium]
MNYALELKNVTKSYKDFTLDNINLCVPQGCIMGFVGENGAGKTTTLKAILNLLHLDSGDIKIFGKDYKAYEQELKQDIGVAFDNCNFHDNLRLNDISRIFAPIYVNWDNEVFKGFCTRFKLPLDKTFKEFSRGMKMKANLAVALSHHAKLLLLDEPTGGLDPVMRDEILDVFLDFIQDETHSILFSSHITGDLEKVADYISFIHDGKLILTKSKDDLLYQYGILKCSTTQYAQIDKSHVLGMRKSAFGCEVLVDNKPELLLSGKFTFDNTTIDDIILLYNKGVQQ